MALPILTNENYYDQINALKYCSASQLKAFDNSNAYGCEARALATIVGDYKEDKSLALTQGSMVDALWEGTFDDFKKEYADEIISKRGATKGELKRDYKICMRMYERSKADPLFAYFMSGEKQRIFTGEIAGVPFRAKLDSYMTVETTSEYLLANDKENLKRLVECGIAVSELPKKAIVDLKTTQSIFKAKTLRDNGTQNFIELMDYYTQLAIYQELVYQNTGERLPCYICAVDKKEHPRTVVVHLEEHEMLSRMEHVKMVAQNIQSIKNGEIEPMRCGHCDYCADTNIQTKVLESNKLLQIFQE